MLSIHISASSGIPVYLQIEQQIKQSLASGLLKPDDPLPSIRRTAAELRINPNTVARAFSNLEREGIIRTVPGGGTFVGSLTTLGSGLLKAEKLRRIRPLVDQLAIEGAQLRLNPDDIHKLLDAAIEDLGRKSRNSTRSSGEQE
ncbi:GntR family transcriptional regulator [Nevskia soli]|uniref:GntR family transcriptional regulator n=1 Tax=Nevskia soli TaxID=418856 RepID=UPI0015D72B58|nr:GntR family transcriptional regulator [Nevskia soli]